MQPLTRPVVHPVECIVPAQFAASTAAGLGCRTLSRPRWSSCCYDLLSRVAEQCLLHEHHACRFACPSPGPRLNSRKSRPCSRRHKTARRAQPRWRTGPTGGRSVPAVHGSRLSTIALRYQVLPDVRGIETGTQHSISSSTHSSETICTKSEDPFMRFLFRNLCRRLEGAIIQHPLLTQKLAEFPSCVAMVSQPRQHRL